MKRIVLILSVILIPLYAHSAMAMEPGDVGTHECRQVQLETQDAVAAGAPYNTHGQMLRTASSVVSLAEDAGEIDCACSSCIINQFARRIPVEEQVPCGNNGWSSNILGPGLSCGGDVAGKATILNLGNDGLEVAIELTNGALNTTFDVFWVCTDIPNGCHADMCDWVNIGQFTTDSSGKGVLEVSLPNGNPFAGQYVHFDICVSDNGGISCTDLSTLYSSTFNVITPSVVY